MSDNPETVSTTSPRWMRIALFVSLALNLLVIGAVASAVLSGGPHGERGERIRGLREIAPPPFVLAVPREERRRMASEFRDRSAAHRLDSAETRVVLETFLSELRADSFDSEKVLSLLADERTRQGRRQESGAEVFVGYLQSLSHDDRRAYADRLERILERHSRR